jgi:WD40 repeat protein
LPAAEKQAWASGRPGVVTSVAFNPDGRRIASGSAMWSSPNAWPIGVIQRWDASSGKPFGHPIKAADPGSAVMSVAFTPHRADTAVGDRIVSGGVDRKVRLWDAESDAGEEISSALLGHSEGVSTVAVSPDGMRIVSGSADGTVRIWPDPPSGPPKDALCAKLTQWRKSESKGITVTDVCPGLPVAPTS